MDVSKVIAGVDSALEKYFDILSQIGYNSSYDTLLIYDMCYFLLSNKEALTSEELKIIDGVINCLQSSCLISFPTYIEKIKNTMHYEKIEDCTDKIYTFLYN